MHDNINLLHCIYVSATDSMNSGYSYNNYSLFDLFLHLIIVLKVIAFKTCVCFIRISKQHCPVLFTSDKWSRGRLSRPLFSTQCYHAINPTIYNYATWRLGITTSYGPLELWHNNYVDLIYTVLKHFMINAHIDVIVT